MHQLVMGPALSTARDRSTLNFPHTHTVAANHNSCSCHRKPLVCFSQIGVFTQYAWRLYKRTRNQRGVVFPPPRVLHGTGSTVLTQVHMLIRKILSIIIIISLFFVFFFSQLITCLHGLQSKFMLKQPFTSSSTAPHNFKNCVEPTTTHPHSTPQ